MNALDPNPFAVLTFIVAPAILTNASAVMGLQTATRFARAIDRSRELSNWVDARRGDQGPEVGLRLRQLEVTEHRAALLLRAVTAFYLSLGAFAAACFSSLLGASFGVAGYEVPRHAATSVALAAGVLGVGGLLSGSGLLVWETRRALAVLHMETAFMRPRRSRPVA
jgi:hypothetical protein